MNYPQSEVEWRLKWLWFGCGFILLLLIAILSLMPVSGVGGGDKIGHVFMYAVLSSWFSLIVSRTGLLWFVLLGAISYGLLMEFLQSLTDYRGAEFADAVANSIGALLGLLFHFSPFRRWLVMIDARLDQLRQ